MARGKSRSDTVAGVVQQAKGLAEKGVKEIVLTGVISANSIAWECVDNEICLDCEQIFKDIEKDETLDEEEKGALGTSGRRS
jgi:tRNA A37 methylthiotransferase MiaB